MFEQVFFLHGRDSRDSRDSGTTGSTRHIDHRCSSDCRPAVAAVLAVSLLLMSCGDGTKASDVNSSPFVPGQTAPALAAAPDQELLVGSYYAPIVFPNTGGAVDDEGGCIVDLSVENAKRLPQGMSLSAVSIGGAVATCQITGTPTEAVAESISITVAGLNVTGRSAATVNIRVGAVFAEVNFSQISIGDSRIVDAHTCSISAEGAAYCWGAGDAGQLGLGETNRAVNVPFQIGSAEDWAQISSGGFHTCAVKKDSTLYCWGYGFPGQLGLGDTDTRMSPTQVNLIADWVNVSAGLFHTCAINNNGELFCWGEGGSGQLGNSLTDDQDLPSSVGGGSDWAQVSAGASHTCAVKTNGSLYCWGAVTLPADGEMNVSLSESPTQVGTATDWQTVSAGSSHSCATKTTGALLCWGANSSGQLGLGDNNDRAMPEQIGTDTDWSNVSAGISSTCAMKAAGQLWCWGDEFTTNTEGELAINTSNSPSRIGTDTNWQAINVGEAHTCGLKGDTATTASIECWGSGTRGRLGLGNENAKLPPGATPTATQTPTSETGT
ncbi:MAG: putative Ig domain-containing protein [Proteobacteria bacterium]|nr:putative Ig domain-containing protein [Pseudomonadota bacterium]